MGVSLYTVRPTERILDNPEKRYILRFRDLPADERPREELFHSGPSLLSLAELFAVVLGIGTTKEDVLTMASRITKEYGEKSILSQTNATVVAKNLDIPLTKAAQIIACLEIGRRLFQKTSFASKTIRTPKDVFSYVKDMRDLSKEHLRGLYLNTHYKIIHDETISIGTMDANIIHPREVFRPALEYNAAAVVLVHNHPSGVLDPSTEDILITQDLIEAGKLLGIHLIDHVIVTDTSYGSIPAEYAA